jgi:hypothetical protein
MRLSNAATASAGRPAAGLLRGATRARVPVTLPSAVASRNAAEELFEVVKVDPDQSWPHPVRPELAAGYPAAESTGADVEGLPRLRERDKPGPGCRASTGGHRMPPPFRVMAAATAQVAERPRVRTASGRSAFTGRTGSQLEFTPVWARRQAKSRGALGHPEPSPARQITRPSPVARSLPTACGSVGPPRVDHRRRPVDHRSARKPPSTDQNGNARHRRAAEDQVQTTSTPSSWRGTSAIADERVFACRTIFADESTFASRTILPMSV